MNWKKKTGRVRTQPILQPKTDKESSLFSLFYSHLNIVVNTPYFLYQPPSPVLLSSSTHVRIVHVLCHRLIDLVRELKPRPARFSSLWDYYEPPPYVYDSIAYPRQFLSRCLSSVLSKWGSFHLRRLYSSHFLRDEKNVYIERFSYS